MDSKHPVVSVCAIAAALSLSGCERPNPIPRLPVAEWRLDVVAMREPGQVEGYELWFVLENSSDRALPFVCPYSWGLEDGPYYPGAVRACRGPEEYLPIPRGTAIVQRVFPWQPWDELARGTTGFRLGFL